MREQIEMPDPVYVDATHQNWQRAIENVSRDLNTIANDIYTCWNQRQAPPLSAVLALWYLKKQLEAALYFARKEKTNA